MSRWNELTSFNPNNPNNQQPHHLHHHNNQRGNNSPDLFNYHHNYSSISQEEFDTPTFDDPSFHPSQQRTHKYSKHFSFLFQFYDACLGFYMKYELIISTSLLILSTASERVTFKFMIDHMYPFKSVLIEIIFLLSFLLFSAVTLYKIHRTKEITSQMRNFPHKEIFIMALLDSIQFIGLVFSGVNVPPTMTVILMHASTIFVVAGSHFAFPHRKYGDLHKYGLGLISGALILSLMKIFWCDWSASDSDHFFNTREALIYVFSSALQGLSTLYKENSLVTWAQPVNIHYLSSFLFLYQFFITFAFAIIYYLGQGSLSSLFSCLLLHFFLFLSFL